MPIFKRTPRSRPTPAKSVVGTSSVWSLHRFSLRQYAVVVVGLLVVAGGVLLFAASSPIASIEAEKMTLPAGASVITDSSASGGQAVKLTQHGTLTSQVNLPATATSLSITAKATNCRGNAARMVVHVDSTAFIPGTAVKSSSWQVYSSATTSIPVGPHTLRIAFTNSNNNCHHTLFIDTATFYGTPPPPPPPPTISLQASPTSIVTGDASTLGWATTNASSCVASGGWNGSRATNGLVSTGTLTNATTYSLTCAGVGGSVSQTVQVGVTKKIALGIAVFDPTYPTTGNQFQNYQAAVGSVPSFVEFFQDPWGQRPLYWMNELQLLTQTNHATPVVSWGTNTIALNSITAGNQNANIDAAIALAKQWPGTMYIRLDWEMNGAWSQWNPSNAAQPAGETPQTFVEMWQYTVNRFRAAGVSNVKWVWAPNIDGGDRPMQPYYPGDNYVDAVGLDGYNYAHYQGSWQTPQQVFAGSYNELEAITKKPVIITETSSVEANASETGQGYSKSQWMQQLSSYVASLSNVIGLCWFDQPTVLSGSNGQVVDFGVNSSPQSLNAWKQFFVTNPQFQGRLP